MITPRQFVRNLPALADVIKQPNPNAAFLILLASEFTTTVLPGRGRILDLNLSANLPVLQTTREKHVFQYACKRDSEAAEYVALLDTPGRHVYSGPLPFRWASGGYLPIFVIDGVRYCMLFLRDLKPVVGWNVANGASDSLEELWLVESILDREPKEEILIINRSTTPWSCLRLESPGGVIQSVDYRQQALDSLNLTARIAMEPLIGRVDHKSPDHIEVSAAWEPKRSPHVTPKGYLIFNPEKGENGIEFIQVVEWEIAEKIHNLIFYDAEMHQDPDLACGRNKGQPIQQAVGLFALEELVRAFHRPEPEPRPRYVYDRGFLLCGDVLQGWLQERPISRLWCPVARKVIWRYIQHSLCGGNSFIKTGNNTWTVAFEGRISHLKHSLGMIYLAHLIQHQGQGISCLELSKLFHPPAVSPPTQQAFDPEAGLAITTGQTSAPVLDQKAMSQILRRTQELKKEMLNQAAELEAARLREDWVAFDRLEKIADEKCAELESTERHLAKDTNVLGHARPQRGDWNERARGAVCHDLARALRNIQQHDRNLWEHFCTFLYKGGVCRYSPSPRTSWSL